jgi:hypothetical protein
MSKYVAGKYALEREDGTFVTVHLTARQAKMMFDLMFVLGFVSIELQC